MSSQTTLQASPLDPLHRALGAKLIDFYGWTLPVQYSSVMEEHLAVRKTAGIFDISHMGQLLVTGPHALSFLQNLTTNDLNRGLEKGVGIYAHLCLPTGGVIDDIFVYGLNANEFFVVVNSSTHEKDLAWLRKNLKEGVEITDLECRGGLAVQGPKALDIIRQTVPGISDLPRFAFRRISGNNAQSSYWGCRTGYTGEDGAEFFGPQETIQTLWNQLLNNGKAFGLKPCGLGARDTLRLEMGYPLYGHELDDKHTPLESNMEWVVKWTKLSFSGREALAKQKNDGVNQQLLAYELMQRGVPRQGAKILKDGMLGGETTSGTFSPSLQKGIGMGFAPRAWNKPGTAIEVEINGRKVSAVVVAPPFYKPSRSL